LYLLFIIIKLPIPFKGSKGEEKLYALFDTGITYSCIREDLCEKLGITDRLPDLK